MPGITATVTSFLIAGERAAPADLAVRRDKRVSLS
jgi:hypothetical protein